MLLTDKPKRNPQYRLETIDGELLLFNPWQTKMLYCNPTASIIWQICDGQQTLQEIINLLVDAYPDAGKEAITADVNETLQQFLEQRAIQIK